VKSSSVHFQLGTANMATGIENFLFFKPDNMTLVYSIINEITTATSALGK